MAVSKARSFIGPRAVLCTLLVILLNRTNDGRWAGEAAESINCISVGIRVIRATIDRIDPGISTSMAVIVTLSFSRLGGASRTERLRVSRGRTPVRG